jgi:hypothetical protein
VRRGDLRQIVARDGSGFWVYDAPALSDAAGLSNWISQMIDIRRHFFGSVPIPVLSARIDRFIADGRNGPYPDLE